MRGALSAVAMTAVLALASAAPAHATSFVWTRGADEDSMSPIDAPLAPRESTDTFAPPCRFADKLTDAALDAGVAPELVIAVAWAETRCRHAGQRSPKGAIGLMQLMPATARRFGAPDPTHLDRNIAAGVGYLRWLSDRYGGDARLTLAAYNAGEGAVDRYRGVPPYAETRAYVASITAALGGVSVHTTTIRASAVARVEAPFVLTFESSDNSRTIGID